MSTTLTYSIGAGGVGVNTAAQGANGGDTSATYNGFTVTARGGTGGLDSLGGGANLVNALGGMASCGNIVVYGGWGGKNDNTENRPGTGGGAIGGVNGADYPGGNAGTGRAGAQSADISGLQAAVVSLGYSWTGPGAGGSSAPNPGSNATGFGCGGGGSGKGAGTGAAGGNGYLGGGGGGASNNSGASAYTGGSGGNGCIVLALWDGAATTYDIKTSGTTYTIPTSTVYFDVWVIAGGGAGTGCPINANHVGQGGGAGGVSKMRFWPGASSAGNLAVTIGAAGAGGAAGGNTGGTGGATTVTWRLTTLTANGGHGGAFNAAGTAAGGTASGGDDATTGGVGGTANTHDLDTGGSGGAVGGTAGGAASAVSPAPNGAQSTDAHGLQAAVTACGFPWTAGGLGSSTSNPSDYVAWAATGFGCGGGAGMENNGGPGLLGGGGGGNGTGAQFGAVAGSPGGGGAAIARLNNGVADTYVLFTETTTFPIKSDTSTLEVWAVGAGGGGGSNSGTTNHRSSGGGGAGGMAHASLRVAYILTSSANAYAATFATLAADTSAVYLLTGNGTTLKVVKLSPADGSETWSYTQAGAGVSGCIGLSSASTVSVSTPSESFSLNTSDGSVADAGFGSGLEAIYYGGTGAAAAAGPSSDTQSYGRTTTLIAVAGGVVKSSTLGGPWTAVSGTLSSTATVIRSAANNQKIYFADGTNWKYYDPATNAVLAWTASAGTLPVDSSGNKPRLICTWRGRTVLSGLKLDGQNWFMSAVGDPTNFDYAPTNVTPTQAVVGNNSPLGLVGDTVTALVPYTDDLLYVGGDHTLWQIQGDPMAGGQISLVSDAVGMAWGNAWTKDPYGAVYFVSNRTGVYRLQPGQGPPVRISQQVEQLLAQIQTSLVAIRMLWDDVEQGFHLFVTPLTVGATTHFFWEQRTNAWWTDVFATNSINPLCCVAFDGNTLNYRIALIGCQDGYVRCFQQAAVTDDGTAMASAVVLGPILTRDLDEVLLKDIQGVLGATSGNVTWSVYVGATAEQALASTAVATGTWGPGRSFNTPIRRAGHALWVKVSATGYWAMEEVRARIAGQGRVRRRTSFGV